MTRTPSYAALTALAFAASGCGLFGAGSSHEFDQRQSRDVTMDVVNQNFYDATLYAVWMNGHRQRIGTVQGNGKSSFTFPWRGNDLQIEILLLSVGSYFTQPMMVDRGDELELVIEPGLDKRARIKRP